jgi:P27 family predicted phage terminase small subunit
MNMARMGRPPKPTNLKLLEGNPGKRPIPKGEPKPMPISPQCPVWLYPEAKAMWSHLMPELERIGLMTIVDGRAFEAACQNYATWVRCEKYLKKNGYTILAPSGYPVQRPEVTVGQKALKAFQSFCTEFGMTPASRSRMDIKQRQVEEDPMDALLRRRGG